MRKEALILLSFCHQSCRQTSSYLRFSLFPSFLALSFPAFFLISLHQLLPSFPSVCFLTVLNMLYCHTFQRKPFLLHTAPFIIILSLSSVQKQTSCNCCVPQLSLPHLLVTPLPIVICLFPKTSKKLVTSLSLYPEHGSQPLSLLNSQQCLTLLTSP